MADKTLAEIEEELTDLDKSYEAGYANQDRHTVDPAGLVTLVARAKGLRGDLERLGALTAGDNAASVLDAIGSRQSLYERELDLVKAAREMGPNFARFSIEGASANFVFDRYNRHYAGQSRETRDLGVLKELVEELKGISKRMTAIGGKKLAEPMQRDLDLVSSNIDRYQVEEREIPKAQTTGTQEDQANRFAFLANQQFALYQTFFAGQSRISRRPELLIRLIDNLRRYRTAMFDLKNRGLNSASNEGNIGIIDSRIKGYEVELKAIRDSRAKPVQLVEIMGSLGSAANDLFQQYRDQYAGKDRRNVDLEQLGNLIDKLDELRRQMEMFGRVEKNDANAKNLQIVREYQSSWVREHQAVRAAQEAQQALKPATND